jgi:two-component system phosphate regulon response regulator PhoB
MPVSGVHEAIRRDDIEVDLRRREVRLRGEPLALKPKEYDLLVHFMRNPGRAYSREQLLDQVWGYEFVADSRTVDVHVSWLRSKIEDEPSKPARLITLRGLGYRFD